MGDVIKIGDLQILETIAKRLNERLGHRYIPKSPRALRRQDHRVLKTIQTAIELAYNQKTMKLVRFDTSELDSV